MANATLSKTNADLAHTVTLPFEPLIRFTIAVVIDRIAYFRSRKHFTETNDLGIPTAVVAGFLTWLACTDHFVDGAWRRCRVIRVTLVDDPIAIVIESVTQLSYGDDIVDIDFPASEQTCSFLDD